LDCCGYRGDWKHTGDHFLWETDWKCKKKCRYCPEYQCVYVCAPPGECRRKCEDIKGRYRSSKITRSYLSMPYHFLIFPDFFLVMYTVTVQVKNMARYVMFANSAGVQHINGAKLLWILSHNFLNRGFFSFFVSRCA